jgi:hypothetical protein
MRIRAVVIASLCTLPLSSNAQSFEAEHVKSVNSMCPIGLEPVEADGGTAEHNGYTIGMCCPGCAAEFSAWDESDRDAFVTLAIAHREPGTDAHSRPFAPVDDTTPAAYPLTVCAFASAAIGSMGDPVVKVYDNREVQFCCDSCVPKFESDIKASLAKLDAKIIKDQMPYYPRIDCVVSDEEFDSEEDGGSIDFVHNGRLIRLCCKGCKREFDKDPAAYHAKLDNAVIIQQSADYPLELCVMSDEEMPEDDILTEVHGNRLFRFCCKGCVRGFFESPHETMAKLDAAWSKARAEQGG